MITEQSIVTLVDAYMQATSLSETTVSSRVFGDSKRVAEIRAGRGITVRRFNASLIWFSNNWPEGAVWPESVMRPAAEAAE